MSQTRVELLAASVDLHNELNLNHGSDTRLRIHTDGKIGVGTSTPSTLFTVKNTTASATGAILVQNASYAASQDFPILIAGTSSWTGANTDWGTFGFQFKLKSDASSVARIAIETSNSGTIVEGVSIEETGYVGLNVTNPAEQLDINGNIKITGTVDGRDVSVDGAKLDGIAAGAEVNVDTDISHTVNTSFIALNSSTGSGTNIAVASTTDAGFMSAADKTKLVGIAPGAEVNVQSDWNATSGDALILNKPTIPTNNNQLTNGAGYITSADGGDAATLDGIDSANFLRSDQEDQATVINIGGEISPTSSAKFQVYGFSRMGPIMLAAGTAGATSFNSNNERWIMNDGSHLYASTSSSGYNNKIWTDGNDGSGSGLDADKLDNLQATSFLRSDASTEFNANGNNFRFNSDGNRVLIDFRYNGTNIWQLRQDNSGANLNFDRVSGSGVFQIDGSKAWHAGNDGSGSGLDADTLDGINSGSFLRSDASDTITGGSILQFQSSSNNTRGYIQATETNDSHLIIATSGGEDIAFKDGGTGGATNFIIRGDGTLLQGTGNLVWHAGNDGSGTGLDADTLDGQQGSYYRQSWPNIDAGTRTNYSLKFQPPTSNYAGFQFLGTNGSNAGYLLIRGTSDSDVYTAEGITLVADQGWLTLAQRTASGKGVRIMTGASASSRLVITTAGDIQFVNGNSITYNSNTVWHAGNDGSGSSLDADTVDGYHFLQTQGISAVGNFGQWQVHNTYSNFNSSINYWGWNYVQGSSNAPNPTSSQWYRNRVSLGSEYGLNYSSNHYWLEMAYPRSNRNSAGHMWVRTCENGSVGSWEQVGSRIIGDFIATGNVTAYSDIRLKGDIKPITDALDKVSQINGVTFTRVDSGERQTGLIAQEVEKVLPEAVRDGEEYKSVAYGNMMGLLIEAVKELTARVEELEEELKAR